MGFLSVVAAFAVCFAAYILVRRRRSRNEHNVVSEVSHSHHRCAVVQADIDLDTDTLSISNVGPGLAEAVDIRFLSLPDPIHPSERLEKLPIASLQSGETCALRLTVGARLEPRVDVSIEWREPCGTAQVFEQTIRPVVAAKVVADEAGLHMRGDLKVWLQ